MKFCELVLELQKFCQSGIDSQTQRHYSEIIKSSSGHPNACKSIKNRKSKIFTKSILNNNKIKMGTTIILYK